MANKKQKLVEDVEFVLSECMRIQSLARESLNKISRDDALYSIPSPTGQGELLCGYAAAMRIRDLAQEAGQRANLLKRVESRTLVRPLKKLISQRFIGEKRQIDIKQIERILSTTGTVASKKCVDTVYFIPCHLMTAQTPDELKIGPIKFLNRQAFRKLILVKIDSYIEEERKHKNTLKRRLLANAIRYYRSFDWIAEVEIKGCDLAVSKELAERAVTSALDCLHLLFGARFTDRMRVGGPALKHDRRGSLTLLPSGALEVSISSNSAGQVNFGDDWPKWLDVPDHKYLIELFGIALEAAVDPDLNRPLSRRFLDAAQWFGEASRDESPSTQIVKYVTSLERMVMTEEKDDITSLLTERVAALCFDWQNPADRDAWRVKARSAYKLRSKLVHGSMSPLAPEILHGVWSGAELCEQTLLHAIARLGENGLKSSQIDSKRLSEWFGDVCKWADNVTTSLPSSPHA